jgi:hypothetical protein
MEYSYLLLLPQQIQFSLCNADMYERWRFSAGDLEKSAVKFNGAVDGARTRDPRRDRPVL